MLFWRTKSTNPVATAPAARKVAEEPGDAAAAPAGAPVDAPSDGHDGQETAVEADCIARTTDTADTDTVDAVDVATAVAVAKSVPETKLVNISPPPSRLADRLADRLSERSAEVLAERSAAQPSSTSLSDVIAPSTSTSAPGQSKALAALRAALAAGGSGSHVLVLGQAGTGRRASAEAIANELAQRLPSPRDWIYASSASDASRLMPFAVPSGAGPRIVRDVRDAFSKSAAMLSRMVAADHHIMALALLEEDHRHRNDAPFELLKRRAEAQNIALVKTADGYMLAPMHEGKVVRADVFRALPEALQRDVEAKVTALEAELQQLIGSLPGNDVATDDRHLAMLQQTAERAIKPNISTARKLAASEANLSPLLDELEAVWMQHAVAGLRRGVDARDLPMPALLPVGRPRADAAPVVVAHSVSAADLLGEIGRDTLGGVSVRPGTLMQANGGYLIIDAWRLVADPAAWAALASALEVGGVVPLAASGMAIVADAIPMNFKLVLVAERETFAKLQAIDPRVAHNFGSVVSFEESATAFDVSESTFAEWAAALADALALRRLKPQISAALYDDARSRAGDRSRVSLDIASLVQTLRAADSAAADAGRDVISAADIEAALQKRVALQSVGAAA